MADLVIGGVPIPGAAAPKLVTADMVKNMKPGAVIVTLRSTKAVVVSPSQRRMPSLITLSTMSFITVWRICPVASRAPRLLR